MKNEYVYPATLLCDFYKISHKDQYPKDTEVIYSTWTPRMSRINGVNEVIAFGFQAFIKQYLMGYFKDNFFNRPLHEVRNEYQRVIKFTLGIEKPDSSHIEALHKLGYLPLKIKAVKEGTKIPIRVPMLTIENTLPEFFWLTNYIETLMSLALWLPITSSTIANEYKKILIDYCKITGGDLNSVAFQGHDFSMRGMSALDSAQSSSAGHLLSFVGTDTIPAILYLEKYYNADIEKELVGTSIPATEHSVMCAYGQDEYEAYKNLVTKVYPEGLVSIVSDTWDLWSVLYNVIGKLKPEIMARDGKVVIRPDSGDPVDIICGDVIIEDLTNDCTDLEEFKRWALDIIDDEIRNSTPHGECGVSESSRVFKFDDKYYNVTVEFDWNRHDKQYYFIDDSRVIKCEEYELTPANKGVVEILWEIFGGTTTGKGYKQLDSHIGCIYGDAITIGRCKSICKKLEKKGFASTNMVYGIGSFTYQYNTRDTFGFALKSTYGIFGGKETMLFKDPITDKAKFKKSQKGLVVVVKKDNKITYIDNLLAEEQERYEEAGEDLLELVYVDGDLIRDEKLSDIRDRLK